MASRIEAIFGADATRRSCPIAADAKSARRARSTTWRSGKQKNVSILFGIATAGDKAIELAVKVKETVNDNGANKDTFLAIGDRRGRSARPATASRPTPPRTPPSSVSTEADGCVPQSTKLDIPGLANGAEVQVGEEADTSCADGPDLLRHRLHGQRQQRRRREARVDHHLAERDVAQQLQPQEAGHHPHRTAARSTRSPTPMPTSAATTPTKTNCIVSAGSSATNLVVSFRTPNNGKIKGAF